jgi:hypothetical protein
MKMPSKIGWLWTLLLALPACAANVTLGPGATLQATFTTAPNTSDLLFFFDLTPAVTTGSPVVTVELLNGSTPLGLFTYAIGPTAFPNILQVGFASVGSTYTALQFSNTGPTIPRADFTSINNGTIAGKLLVTVSGGTIAFNESQLVFYDAVSCAGGCDTPKTDVQNVIYSTSPTQSYYFSDLVVSGGYQTTLTYVNYSPQAVTCVTNFYLDNGNPWSIPFGQGSISTRTDTIQPGQSIHDQTVANLAPPFVEGWAQASCSGPVQASLLYRLYESGAPVGEAGVNAETQPTTEFATFAQTATGIAYANPSTTQTATITIEAYNTGGLSLGSHIVALAPLGHGSDNVAPLLGLTSFTGFIKITSNIPIISLSLNAEVFPVFSSLPPGDLPSGTGLVTP